MLKVGPGAAETEASVSVESGGQRNRNYKNKKGENVYLFYLCASTCELLTGLSQRSHLDTIRTEIKSNCYFHLETIILLYISSPCKVFLQCEL